MTLIECFTQADIDNVASCLRLRPEKLILIGRQKEMPLARYEKLLRKRKQKTKIQPCNVEHKSCQEICNALHKLLLQEKKCVIDITGGDETVILAVGMVLVQIDPAMRQNVRVEKYDHVRGVVTDCVRNRRLPNTRPVNLTVEELILLHGGCIHPDSYQPPAAFEYTDLEPVWQLSKDWNDGIGKLLEFEKRSTAQNPLEISAPWSDLHSISRFTEKEAIVEDLLDKMHRKGIINDYSNFYCMQYEYRSEELRYCTAKAGNVLEMKTLLEARSVTENGVPYFGDCRMSVSMDWDGVVNSAKPGTNNEIDVVLMRGTTPLFISCKNGDVEEEELYKLNTVANRMGGKYVRKMLVATNFNKGEAFAQRARDMGIYLAANVADLSHDQWREILVKAVQ